MRCYIPLGLTTVNEAIKGPRRSLRLLARLFCAREVVLCVVNEYSSLTPQAIMVLLNTRVIGRDVLVFRETASTNDLARHAGDSGAAEGIVFFAERQTAGRGTHGRTWISAPNQGLWFSILLRAKLPLDQCSILVQLAAIAVAEAVEPWLEEPVRIKLPNDLVLGGGKLAGFLLETSNRSSFQVLGIGINVRSAPEIPGFPTSALDHFSKAPVPLNELAATILNRLDVWYATKPFEEVGPAFRARLLG